MNKTVNRATRNYLHAAVSWGHFCKKAAKRRASKARRNLSKAITTAALKDKD